jgi:hypothetical protein
MIAIATDSVRLGDTLRLRWDLPQGSTILLGPAGDDSLAVWPDTSRPGQWLLQPLAEGARGGDTLRATSPRGDTLVEIAPRWKAVGVTSGADTSVAAFLPPRDRPVPLPWNAIALGTGALLLVVALLWAWRRHRAKRPPVAIAAPPPMPPHERVRAALEALETSYRAGLPGRDVAFQAGVLLRGLHGEILSWNDAEDSTSREWRAMIAKRLPSAHEALGTFLDEADPLRYADDLRSAGTLLERARAVVEASVAPATGARSG